MRRLKLGFWAESRGKLLGKEGCMYSQDLRPTANDWSDGQGCG